MTMRRALVFLFALTALLVPTPVGAQDRTLLIDTWLEGGSGGYNLQVWSEAGSQELRLELWHREHGWLGVQAIEWVPLSMGSVGWGSGNQWTGAPGAVWMCHQDPNRGMVAGYNGSLFYAFGETSSGALLTFIGSDNRHGPYVDRSNVWSGWTNQWCVQLTLR